LWADKQFDAEKSCPAYSDLVKQLLSSFATPMKLGSDDLAQSPGL